MRIYDGRESFAQWDMNMKVTDETFKVGEKIDFYNGTTENALVMLAYEYNGVVVADVPNIFFTLPLPIMVYRCVDEDSCSCTKEMHKFEVRKRPKPDDYVYEQTEVYTIASAVELALKECKESGEFDGKDGKDGKPGEPGKDGKDGKDGYTPQREIDYWTPEDQAEIKTYVDALVNPLMEEINGVEEELSLINEGGVE